jgi:hypothetical protein
MLITFTQSCLLTNSLDREKLLYNGLEYYASRKRCFRMNPDLEGATNTTLWWQARSANSEQAGQLLGVIEAVILLLGSSYSYTLQQGETPLPNHHSPHWLPQNPRVGGITKAGMCN